MFFYDILMNIHNIFKIHEIKKKKKLLLDEVTGPLMKSCYPTYIYDFKCMNGYLIITKNKFIMFYK